MLNTAAVTLNSGLKRLSNHYGRGTLSSRHLALKTRAGDPTSSMRKASVRVDESTPRMWHGASVAPLDDAAPTRPVDAHAMVSNEVTPDPVVVLTSFARSDLR
jgi:hypothetical protein